MTALLEERHSPHTMGQLRQQALQRMEPNLKIRQVRETPLKNYQKDLHLLKKAAMHKAQVNSN